MVIVDGQSTTGDNYDDISMYRAVDLNQLFRSFAMLKAELAKSQARIAKLEETRSHGITIVSSVFS